MDEASLDRAASAIRAGDLVAYPTETVYGLGAAALDAGAVERVFEAKSRPRDRPLSLAVPDLAAADRVATLDDRERQFVETFLPGPVTVVARKRPTVPDVLTAGNERVGLRIPDHPVALALLDRVAPITATSANPSGGANARRPADLAPSIREACAVVLDPADGATPGGESTVVDVAGDEILRRGARADDVAAWLAAH